MTPIKKVDFGERLVKVMKERFPDESQEEFGKRFGRTQSSIARWVANPNFAATKSIKKLLEVLREYGVNPEFFWNPIVEDWRIPVEKAVDEVSIYKLRTILESVKRERDELKANLERVKKELKDCREKK